MYKRLELHNHTNESDAVFTCKELTDFMVADQVDAFALTDHNTISGHCKIKNYLKEHPQPIAFIPGMEYTTYYGHILCLNLTEKLREQTKEKVCIVSAKTGAGIAELKEWMIRMVPEGFGGRTITGDLVSEGEVVLLVMPQDIQAPKGRLILPQVQTMRELLDKKCIVLSTTTDKLVEALDQLKNPPKLIITDSQVFDYVYDHKPTESLLTSFSVLFADYKGDLDYYKEGAKKLMNLSSDSRVLIAECCTHAPLKEDIGREKIPRMLKKKYGETLKVTVVSGTDYPKDLTPYDLIIQCGACMFNRKYVLHRIQQAKNQGVAMTNYGVAIAQLKGILDKIVC